MCRSLHIRGNQNLAELSRPDKECASAFNALIISLKSETEMLFRTFTSGLIALTFTLVAAGGAGAAGLSGLPVAGASNSVGAPVILAQANDAGSVALEEEIRRLNGRVEELNFQILQMQDQLRRMQEDNEFRFQELESKHSSDAAGSAAPRQPAQLPADNATTAGTSNDAGQDGQATLGEPPRELGTITLDQNGNVVSNGADGPVDLLNGQLPPPSGAESTVAALPSSDNPEEIYRNAYEFVLSGDYTTAEAGFRQYIERFPDGGNVADAHFWLGESLLGQDRYREAAETFLQANRDYPSSNKAPEMLLKLGVSLTALDQIDVACATFQEIGQRYPQISDALRERVRSERASAGC